MGNLLKERLEKEKRNQGYAFNTEAGRALDKGAEIALVACRAWIMNNYQDYPNIDTLLREMQKQLGEIE